MPNPRGRNGYAIAPSDEAIRPPVERLVASGYTNPEIISRLREHNRRDVRVGILEAKDEYSGATGR
ncbi:uncharacterized protein F5147DRAFT_694268 [Suillus discolor]|uniref:Uncharacterized protein n=1 Tax=Suillus discolor TaxID=1912936 RepID=A0A9P7JTX5_9AGAM|nr:uncharacterized protein F5147DRAFT_694268 [Suillus discolor]KAG2108663.1 hypothetical protein F5147DRAFT_694268 [Suillus discolor]